MSCPTCERLMEQVDTFALAAARARIRELEESVDRLNRAQPRKAAVELACEIADLDPRVNKGEQECFFCGSEGSHRQDCVWKRASVVAVAHRRDLRRQLVKEWAS